MYDEKENYIYSILRVQCGHYWKKDNGQFSLFVCFKQLFCLIDRWLINAKTIHNTSKQQFSKLDTFNNKTEQTTKACAFLSFPSIFFPLNHTFPISKRMKIGWITLNDSTCLHHLCKNLSIEAQHLNDLLRQHIQRMARWIQHQASSLPCSIHISLIVQLANVTRTSCSSVQQSPSAIVKRETATRRLHVSRGEIEYHASCIHGVVPVEHRTVVGSGKK